MPLDSILLRNWTCGTYKTITSVLLGICGLVVVIFTVYSFSESYDGLSIPIPNWHPSSTNGKPTASGSSSAFEELTNDTPSYCDTFNFEGIGIVVKTGATVAWERLPMLLLTSLRCVPKPMLFSDLDQTVGPYQVHDVLTRMSRDDVILNPDFDIYRQQKELQAQGREGAIPALGSIPIVNEDWRTPGKSAAWGLDKYKFLHMIERAWEMQPGKDWYVFIEADTYVSLPNLLPWLNSQDSRQPWYFGKAVRMYEHETVLFFGHGGSGFVLSGAAVKAFAVNHRGIANRFDRRIRRSWFGDFIVADALDEELDLRITDVFPMLNDDQPEFVPFGDHNWCTPMVTFHPVDSARMDQYYDYEKSHGFTGMLYKDLYSMTYVDAFPFNKDHWDNLSEDERFALPIVPNDPTQMHGNFDPKDLVDPHSFYWACENACVQNEYCLQFSYLDTVTKTPDGKDGHNGQCRLSSVFRLGRDAKESELKPGQYIFSGWRSDRIAKWVESHQCSESPIDSTD